MNVTKRLRWDELPADVRAALQQELGASVVSATTQSGGFTPGVAARLALDDGRVLFLKATSNTLGQADSYRAEARITAGLPPEVAAPRPQLHYDDGEWVALGFDFVQGRQPSLPWVERDLAVVLPALDVLAAQLTPSPVPGLPPIADVLGPMCSYWRTTDSAAVTHEWARTHHDVLVELETRLLPAVRGTSMLHFDLRADNLLIRNDGTVFVVDWSWPCTGAAWVDVVPFAVTVAVHGGHDPERLLARSAVARDAPAEAVNALLAGIGGYWLGAAQEPEPSHGPGLRAQQAASAAVSLDWLARRLDDRPVEAPSDSLRQGRQHSEVSRAGRTGAEQPRTL